jgi:thiamine-monophosphate kinase
MADLGHLCSASGFGTRIELEALPLSPAARAALLLRPELTGLVAGGGDDYEILFTAAPGSAGRIGAVAAETGVPVTRIGTVVRAGEGVSAVDAQGSPVTFKQLGYRHF